MRTLTKALAPLAIAAVVLSMSVPVNAQGSLYVDYSCDVLPGSDLQAPWEVLGSNGSLSVSNGVLTMEDGGLDAWIMSHRWEPNLPLFPFVQVEARLKVDSGNGWASSPMLAVYAYDPVRPPTNIASLWYELDLFPDRIELARIVNEATSVRTVFAVVPVDLAGGYHVVGISREVMGNTLRVTAYLDGVPVAVQENEPAGTPLSAVGFGYGLWEGAGVSHWDFVRYWSERPVRTQSATWGAVKALYR